MASSAPAPSFKRAKGPVKRRADNEAAWPQKGRCLRCLKHLMIDPDSECITDVGHRNCGRCTKNGDDCSKVPYSLHEDARRYEDLAGALVRFLAGQNAIANNENLDEGGRAAALWDFAGFKAQKKLEHSGSRLKIEGDTWKGVPHEYKDLYLYGVKFQTRLGEINKNASVAAASDQDNKMFSLMREMIYEFRAFREHNIEENDPEAGGISEDVLRWFDKSL
ncbi:hypothetical protein G7Y89_g11044 [Cudoniella acicularis]|uniref:Uncharacterized protein n=1 Tax=Cudoniella acicularis TaxID=354080 RepID=A0A8H4RCN7_9HELO|nr:hypothetical protein G7Y89_g11044 [Cudoniella acicularis]